MFNAFYTRLKDTSASLRKRDLDVSKRLLTLNKNCSGWSYMQHCLAQKSMCTQNELIEMAVNKISNMHGLAMKEDAKDFLLMSHTLVLILSNDDYLSPALPKSSALFLATHPQPSSFHLFCQRTVVYHARLARPRLVRRDWHRVTFEVSPPASITHFCPYINFPATLCLDHLVPTFHIYSTQHFPVVMTTHPRQARFTIR